MASQGPRSAQATRGGSSRITRPSSISITRSAHGATSSTRCSMIDHTGSSPRAASRRRVPSTSCAPTGSRSESGSSRTRTRGLHRQGGGDRGALLLPAGQCHHGCAPQAGHPGHLKAPFDPGGDLRLRQGQILGTERDLGHHRLVDQLQVRVLEHHADQLGRLVRRQPGETLAAEGHRPRAAPRVPGTGSGPPAMSASVDLPQPDTPVTSTSSPGATPKFTCRSAARAAPR